MSETKVVVGVDGWNPGPYPGCQRWTGTLADTQGAVTDLRLVVDAYPGAGIERTVFQVVHYGERSAPVARLCMGQSSWHRNRPRPGFRAPTGIAAGIVYGPHSHAWVDNRHLASEHRLPEDLYFARPVAENIRTFSASFWHFCQVNAIMCAHDLAPSDAPTAGLLI